MAAGNIFGGDDAAIKVERKVRNLTVRCREEKKRGNSWEMAQYKQRLLCGCCTTVTFERRLGTVPDAWPARTQVC